ncbi:MAG: xylulokinase [Candidatus Ratteibacteria bacterium]|nr:xylulokinase [Candidatus Ratteibacteria bacterium]
MYLLGIDVGTTGVKILLIDEDGGIKGSVTEEYPLFTPRPGWAEQNPSDWWTATVKGMRELLEEAGVKGSDIKSIGLTGQMHGSVFLNGKGDVIHPAILWCDQRTAKECEEITERVGSERIFEITCNPVLTGFQAPKIMWLKKNCPDVYKNVSKVLLPKDYIRFCLTGTFATDVADASGTSLFDVKKRKWSKEILDVLDIPFSFVPECFESPEITGSVTKDASRVTGLEEGTPVVAGAGDQAAGGVGSGIVKEGLISVSLGTSGVVFAHIEDILVDTRGRLHTFCHAVPEKWHIMGVMLSAGGSFRWLRDTFFNKETSYTVMTDMADSVPAGSEGLVFLPYLTGERCPYPDPDARGVFFGISLKHRKEHFIRAVMEGVSFGLKDILMAMREVRVHKGKKFRVTGGGARSELWCGMMADIFNGETVRLNVEEGPSFGAAILAGVGAGIYNDVESACKKLVKEEKRYFKQNKKNTEVYEKFYTLYGNLYKNLEGLFDNLSEIS